KAVKPPSIEKGPLSAKTPTVPPTFNARAAIASNAVQRGNTCDDRTLPANENALMEEIPERLIGVLRSGGRSGEGGSDHRTGDEQDPGDRPTASPPANRHRT